MTYGYEFGECLLALSDLFKQRFFIQRIWISSNYFVILPITLFPPSHRWQYVYPMPEAELQKMRSEFEAYDREMETRYERLLSGFQHVSSVEDINEAGDGLQALQEYFFDSVRLAEAAGLEKRYRDLFRSATLTSEQIGKNEYILRTQLCGAPFVTGNEDQ